MKSLLELVEMEVRELLSSAMISLAMIFRLLRARRWGA